MKNLLYYVKKNGNKTFDDLEFNENDALLLAQLSYLYFEKVIYNNSKGYSLKSVMTDENALTLCFGAMNFKNNMRLVHIFQNITRYDNIIFSDLVSNFDIYKKQQFFAMTFWLEDVLFISFRGTDLSMAGWREDFNMWFSKATPCQIDAVKYTEMIYEKYHRKMILSGHSKGGNLAFYSGLYSKPEVIDNMIKIISFDGPGLKDKEPFESKEYERIKDRCVTYSSASSIVAILLYHVEDVIFLKSRSISILQHSAYNWYIDTERNLKRIRNNKLLSRFLDRALTKFLLVTTDRERERFVDILFMLAEHNPNQTLLDIKYHPFSYIRNIIRRKKLLKYSQWKFLKLEFKKMRLCFKDVYEARRNTRKLEAKKRKAKKLLLSKSKKNYKSNKKIVNSKESA